MYQFIIIDDGIGWTLSPIGFDCINRVHFFILNILNSRYSPDICPIYFGNLIVFDSRMLVALSFFPTLSWYLKMSLREYNFIENNSNQKSNIIKTKI